LAKGPLKIDESNDEKCANDISNQSPSDVKECVVVYNLTSSQNVTFIQNLDIQNTEMRENNTDIKFSQRMKTILYRLFLTNHSNVNESHHKNVLYMILVVFLMSCLPRAILNFAELFFIFEWYNNPDNTSTLCLDLPVWFIVTTYISNLFQMINSSIGLPIYCLICETFRQEFTEGLRKLWNFVKRH